MSEEYLLTGSHNISPLNHPKLLEKRFLALSMAFFRINNNFRTLGPHLHVSLRIVWKPHIFISISNLARIYCRWGDIIFPNYSRNLKSGYQFWQINYFWLRQTDIKTKLNFGHTSLLLLPWLEITLLWNPSK